MKKLTKRLVAVAFILSIAFTSNLNAQGVTLPPNGGNQHSQISQWMGLVKITLDYYSPDVDGREGKIWGEGNLIQYGLASQFGSNPIPWRGAANENVVFTTTHDIKVEGKDLPAGSYGLHFIPGKDEFVVIFSKNYTSWGSFSYDEKEDALRVTVKPQEAHYREYLAYDFDVRKLNTATFSVHWDKLKVPVTISTNSVELYIANIRNELRSTAGFRWQGYQQAAAFCVQNNTNLEEALTWANSSIAGTFGSQANFTTLRTKAQILTALERTKEADSTMLAALKHPTADAGSIYGYGRQLIGQGKKEKALEAFKLNLKKHPDHWLAPHGLARIYSSMGDFKKAIKYEKQALANSTLPAGSKPFLDGFLKKLESNEDFN